MIVFKTFLKVLNKCKAPVIMFTAILICFAGLNMKTSDNSMSFVASKPDVLIVNKDNDIGVTKNLVNYIRDNSNIIDVKNTEEAISDALFYRDVNYIIYIPENYRSDFLNGKNPKVEVRSTGDYQASIAEMNLERYMNIANIYNSSINNEDELISKINETLSKQAKIVVNSKLDTVAMEKATYYFNFANYSILAGCVYVICLILSSFKDEKVRKRTVISSTNYGIYNLKLLMSNILFAVIMWIFYVVLGCLLVGKVLFTTHGLVYIANSFVFTICATTIAFLIGNLVSNKNAINGIVNVVALGSSFLCGAFVPTEMLPDAVLKIAHILPSYYYINSNDRLFSIESITFESIKPILCNMLIMLLFSIGFIIITNIISKKKRKLQ